MGILNIGPDSVADDLELRTLPQQLDRARRLVREGADIIDVGVQSGRTDTPTISAEDEVERLSPLVRALADEGIAVSVDTWRPSVVEAVIAAGASLINDVSGLADERVAEAAARSGVGLVLMHTRAGPKSEHFPVYADPMADVQAFLGERIATAHAHGVAREQIVIDPGLDFAKRPSDSIEVLRHLDELKSLEQPLLLAVSRKYFIGMLTGAEPLDRLAGTLAAVGHGVDRGASIVRVHDVGAASQYLAVRRALRGSGQATLKGDPDSDALKWLAPKDRTA